MRRWPAFSHDSQMPDLASLILGQILHSTEQNTSQMLGVGGGAMGDVGIDWHINYTKSYAGTVGKDQFFYLDTFSRTTEASSSAII